jgi:A/G-specific adenine glycosylase
MVKMNFQKYRQSVLNWYDAHGRDLPWRYKNGAKPHPYRVWLSEIMLQQTTVTAVKPYFERFVSEWPSVQDLAAAPREDIMNAWAGLGYYSRARNLHACAQMVVNEYDGVFPQDQKALKSLPGIGDYTSAAIMSIAFNKPAVVMDGNIERIMSRVFTIDTPLPKAKAEIKTAAQPFFESNDNRYGDFVQALMDIGATICTPKAPKCMLCPLQEGCRAYKEGSMETYPVKPKKKDLPHKYGEVYIISNDNGEVLIETRPDKGLLAGMNGLPTSAWVKDKLSAASFRRRPESSAILDVLDPGLRRDDNITEKIVKPQHIGKVRHVFTHFSLELMVVKLNFNKDIQMPDNHKFYSLKEIETMGFPTVFQKCLNMAFDKNEKSM